MIPAVLHAVVLPPLLALVVSSVTIVVLLRSRIVKIALDHPNSRSLHATPVPRLGGLGIMAGIGAAWLYLMPMTNPAFLIALVLLISISLIDDLKGVAIGWRLLVHLISASLLAFAVIGDYDWWMWGVVALATAWMINLYNFMDGADGLASGMSVFGFGSYGIASLFAGDIQFAAVNFSVAAAALGFLLFNFPPARIFMGDVGAIPLGGLAAAMNVIGWQRSEWPWWFGIVAFSPFIVDASLTLFRRLARGAKIWQAHREHFYQRLVQSGWGHRKTAYAEYALMLVCGCLALAGMRQGTSVQVAIIGAVGLLYVALVAVAEKFLRRHADD